MSSGESGKKKDIKQRKKRKSKRPATSLLNDNERPGKSGSLSCNGDRPYNNNNSDGNFVNGNIVSNSVVLVITLRILRISQIWHCHSLLKGFRLLLRVPIQIPLNHPRCLQCLQWSTLSPQNGRRF